ncbi:Uncharacterised protein [Nocardia cyriacigeorgica]|uniref:Uncharacterized protein n=1 Tax=Nocardia cyriacigeorgica TaxID=135487 RepID=A0A4U8WAY8_9NOCA|nr:Uncharacterised protein [Nocardia cyriacigeorgica]
MSVTTRSAPEAPSVNRPSRATDRQTAKAFLVVAATIVIPYALWPVIIIWAVLYFGARGFKRLFLCSS